MRETESWRLMRAPFWWRCQPVPFLLFVSPNNVCDFLGAYDALLEIEEGTQQQPKP